MKQSERFYRVREFAQLTGITVRTLHHYDRIGLLKPRARTNAGYRVYGQEEITRLQQIVTLKFIGLSLTEIRDILHRGNPRPAEMLRSQRLLLEQRRGHLDRAIHALAAAEQMAEATGEPDSEVLRKIIEVINMATSKDWMMKYYSDSAQAKISERARNWTPELQAEIQQEWDKVFREIEALIAAGADPQGEQAQAVTKRYRNLVEQFTGGDPEICDGLTKFYRDRENWPASWKAPCSQAVLDFMAKARS